MLSAEGGVPPGKPALVPDAPLQELVPSSILPYSGVLQAVPYPPVLSVHLLPDVSGPGLVPQAFPDRALQAFPGRMPQSGSDPVPQIFPGRALQAFPDRAPQNGSDPVPQAFPGLVPQVSPAGNVPGLRGAPLSDP